MLQYVGFITLLVIGVPSFAKEPPPKVKAKLLNACPKGIEGCMVESLDLYSTSEEGLGSDIIKPKTQVQVESNGKILKISLKAIPGEANCSATYPYGKLAWVGGDTILTSEGPVAASKVFSKFQLRKSYTQIGYSTSLRPLNGGEELTYSGGKLDPRNFFVKDGRIARKSAQGCLELGIKYTKADWCEEKFGFAKKAEKIEAGAGGSKTVRKSKDQTYEFVISYSPAC